MNTQRLASLLLTAVIALITAPAVAQTGAPYPVRPVKIVVVVSAGGYNDIVARLIAQKLSDNLKQPFVVENRPGGNSIPGADYVAKSAPDGYTLLLGNTSVLTILVSLYSKLPYDPQRDFVPISLLAINGTVLVVPSSLPARNVKELIVLAKAGQGKLNYASPGSGTPFHLSAELFKVQTQTQMVHVPYKGNAPALLDLLAGRVQLMFANVPEVMPHVSGGKLRALAFTGSKRHELLPDVPMMAETGIRDAESFSFLAIVAPRGTPRDIVATLNAEFARAKAQPDVRQRLSELGVEPGTDSLEELDTFLRNQTAKWAIAVKASGAKVDY